MKVRSAFFRRLLDETMTGWRARADVWHATSSSTPRTTGNGGTWPVGVGSQSVRVASPRRRRAMDLDLRIPALGPSATVFATLRCSSPSVVSRRRRGNTSISRLRSSIVGPFHTPCPAAATILDGVADGRALARAAAPHLGRATTTPAAAGATELPHRILRHDGWRRRRAPERPPRLGNNTFIGNALDASANLAYFEFTALPPTTTYERADFCELYDHGDPHQLTASAQIWRERADARSAARRAVRRGNVQGG